MQIYSVNVICDVTAKVLDHPFRYRVYVNNELFAERTWIWQGVYLEEMLPISAPAGVYPIRFETVDPDHGKIKVRNYRTNVDVIQKRIEELEYQLKHNNVAKAPIEQAIKSEKINLELCKQQGQARIIMYQGETALEISNESI